MSSFVKILLHVPDSATTMQETLDLRTADNQVSVQALQELLPAMVAGSQIAYAKISTGAVQATGTITLASFVQDDTVTINGVVLTGKTSPSTTSQFAVDADDEVTAANLAAFINASALAHIVNVVTATSALKVVTLTAVQPGLSGNQQTIAISAHGSVSGSGRLASGTDGSQVAINFGAAS